MRAISLVSHSGLARVTLVALVSCSIVRAEEYEWPLELPRILTSSFGEYRVGRFHMGIDLRTGPIGKRVHAAGDGYISRLRCSPYGYGKAVYLTLADGHTLVYAHLNDFAPGMRDYVRRAQHRAESYVVDLFPEPGEFPVARGDVIAFSGQTGIGVPHLHYEIRNPSGHAINPRTVGVDWPDKTRPTIRKVAIIPGSVASTVEGDFLPRTMTVRRLSTGAYTTDPVHVSGRIGVGVEIVDPANGGSTRLGIHTLESEIDGETSFLLRYDLISYGGNNDGVVAYHPYLRDEGRFLLLWRWPNNSCEAFAFPNGDGWIDVGDEARSLTIRAVDFHGNEATVEIPLLPDPREPEPESEHPRPAQDGNPAGSVRVDYFGAWPVVTAHFTESQRSAPILKIDNAALPHGTFRKIDDRTYRAAVEFAPDTEEMTLSVEHPNLPPFTETYAVHRRGSGTRLLDFGDLQITLGSRSAYDVFMIRVSEEATPKSQHLSPLGKTYEVWPKETPLDEAVVISFPIPAQATQAERLRVYRKTKKGWAVETTRRIGGRLEIETRRLGAFAVLEDTRAPSIRIRSPRDGATLAGRRPVIRASIDDAGSGIAAYRVERDGEWLLMAYDPETKTLEWEQDVDLPTGRISVDIEVTDNSGNISTKRVQFTVSD